MVLNMDAKLKSKLARQKRKFEKQEAMKGNKLSGKWWKDAEKKTKFSSIKNKDNTKQKNLKLQMKNKDELKALKQRKQEIINAKKEQSEHRRERCKLNKERTLENQRKAEVVQVIKNTNKIKKMKKSQLRQIETRDTDQIKTR